MEIRRTLAGIAVIAVTAGGLSGAAWAGVLDGKTFVVKAGEAGSKADEYDQLVFSDGRFRSKACDPFGFGDAAYIVVSDRGGSVTFDAETLSGKEGRIKWNGTVTGNSIKGTYIWYKKPKWYRILGKDQFGPAIAKDTVEYSYSGNVKSQ